MHAPLKEIAGIVDHAGEQLGTSGVESDHPAGHKEDAIYRADG
jgi:hypothetical protein